MKVANSDRIVMETSTPSSHGCRAIDSSLLSVRAINFRASGSEAVSRSRLKRVHK